MFLDASLLQNNNTKHTTSYYEITNTDQRIQFIKQQPRATHLGLRMLQCPFLGSLVICIPVTVEHSGNIGYERILWVWVAKERTYRKQDL
jgi:hypothetical protein